MPYGNNKDWYQNETFIKSINLTYRYINQALELLQKDYIKFGRVRVLRTFVCSQTFAVSQSKRKTGKTVRKCLQTFVSRLNGVHSYISLLLVLLDVSQTPRLYFSVKLSEFPCDPYKQKII